MTVKKQPLYQGRDWFSERWTVSKAYSALDKIHDLCHYQMREHSTSLFKNRLPLLSLLMEHIDIFHKNLLFLTCELIPSNQPIHNRPQGWIVFELQQLEKELAEHVTDLSGPDQSIVLKKISALTLTIKDRIRKIDQ